MIDNINDILELTKDIPVRRCKICKKKLSYAQSLDRQLDEHENCWIEYDD